MSPRPTALVTGASGGLGEALAREFARRGFDLVLTARSEDKLAALAEELTSARGLAASAIAADLAAPDGAARLTAELARRGLAVDVLVNNAGFATYGRFDELPLEGELGLLRVNVVALTELTRWLLPGMVARRRGRVLNVASTAAFMPGPLMASYYASKAYVLSFSEALAEELGGSGVTVTALCPGPTGTGFQARAGMEGSRLVRGRRLASASEVAREGVAAMLRGQPVVIPGTANRLQAFLPRLLPRSLLPGVVKRAQARSH